MDIHCTYTETRNKTGVKSMCVVTMKSMTLAIRAKAALQAKGIATEIQNLDPSVTARGCAYGLSFNCSDKALIKRIFDSKGLGYGEWIGSDRAGLAVYHDLS